MANEPFVASPILSNFGYNISTGIFNNISEFPIYSMMISRADFTQKSIESLYQRVIRDVFANIKNLDLMVEESLYSNTASIDEYYGLMSIISQALFQNRKNLYRVEIINGNVIYTLVTEDIANLAKEQILVIDGSVGKSDILHDFYSMLYLFYHHCNIAMRLSNKPVVKLDTLRATNGTGDEDLIQEQIRHTMRILKTENGVGVFDGKDDVSLIKTESDKYKFLVATANEGISTNTGLPISYITGQQQGSLNSTGVGDEIMLERTLSSLYDGLIKPILKRIYQITIPAEYKAVYVENVATKLMAMSSILTALNNDNLLSDDLKISVIKSSLGIEYDEKNKEQEKEEI